MLEYAKPWQDVDVLINIITCYRVSALIHMLSKRVELITVQTDEHHDPLTLVLQLRKLFEYNKKLNRNYSLRVANSLGAGILIFLQSISAYWQVYGLHYVVNCYEYRAPIATVFAHGYVWYELLSIAYSATRLNSSVQSLILEIDRKITMDGYQLQYRKQMEIVMLELAHTPVEFTALDFVSVNNNLATDFRDFLHDDFRPVHDLSSKPLAHSALELYHEQFPESYFNHSLRVLE
ncbi:hypothetical protein J6590_091656 [Homalodisca vitripennis]|nr:hypothetical protein J6590_097828 [Homalodisca vitripennis]KAG8299820.1 hypothetical protein J6590_091656 [Homalodisca vitripennis]